MSYTDIYHNTNADRDKDHPFFDRVSLAFSGWLVLSGTEITSVKKIALVYLTHLSRMEFPTIINWTGHFRFKGCTVVFYIFIQISIKYSVSKQWRPLSDAPFCGV